MTRATAEERALARATIYRLLAVALTYPTDESIESLDALLPRARVASSLLGEDVARGFEAVEQSLVGHSARDLERAYQAVFSITFSGECPLWETAFSARQIFQQNAQLADIAGFYRAFGVDPAGERADHLAIELEFLFLLALKEAHARARGEHQHVKVCRDAQRTFLRDHLARWAPLIGNRIARRAEDGPYRAVGRLLIALLAEDQRFLRLGRIELLRDEPVLIADEPGEMTCPFAGDAAEPVDRSRGPVELRDFESPEEAEHALASTL